MLIVLQVSPLACKRAFYRPEHNGKQRPKELNFTVIKIRKWNIPTVRAQRVDFTPNVTNDSFFLYFLLMTAENLSQSGAKYFGAPERSCQIFHKMVWSMGFGVTICEILRVEISEKLLSQQKIPNSCISNGWWLLRTR